MIESKRAIDHTIVVKASVHMQQMSQAMTKLNRVEKQGKDKDKINASFNLR